MFRYSSEDQQRLLKYDESFESEDLFGLSLCKESEGESEDSSENEAELSRRRTTFIDLPEFIKDKKEFGLEKHKFYTTMKKAVGLL